MKKKIGGFIEGLTKKEEGKGEPPRKEEAPETLPVKEPEKVPAKPAAPPEKKAEARPKAPEPRKEAKPAPKEPERPEALKRETPGAEPEGKKAPAVPEQTAKAEPKPQKPEPKTESAPIFQKPRPAPKAPEKATETEKEPVPAPKIIEPSAPPDEAPAPPVKEEEKPRERIRLGIVTAVKSFITREVEITESDVKDMLDSLELELLEADVEMGVAEGIRSELAGKLIGAKIRKEDLHPFVSSSIRETLVSVLTNEKSFDLAEKMRESERPLKVMFLGINGAGKTTTIAKVAKLLMGRGGKVVFAAADTFRAAAIEQMGVHADRLGVKVVKRDYGSDPTSVAYDAVNFARAHGIDAVLIDTAGRQDTNISLINEMKKMTRVIQPDVKIYIGESIAGNAIIEQISAFDREIGIDAVILTKLDCDPKGGTMLSINRATGIPIIYVGVGQGYDDLERFDPERIVERIVE